MADIKFLRKRAKDYLNRQLEDEDYGCSGGFDSIIQAYEDGAIEQKQLDIDRACNLLEEYIREGSATEDYVRREIAKFRKAMDM